MPRRPTTSPRLSRSASIVTPAPVVLVPATPATAPNDENAVPASKSPQPLSSIKETRALEHDRQRLKKAAALLQRKARKAQPPQQVQAKTHHTGSLRGPGVRIDDDQPAIEENEVEWGGATSPIRSKDDSVTSADIRTEVSLSDLLIVRKPRHSRIPERDFEVVPAVRSVIVLDDFTVPELDPGEPWEHVYLSDADDTNPSERELSYAKIAALN